MIGSINIVPKNLGFGVAQAENTMSGPSLTSPFALNTLFQLEIYDPVEQSKEIAKPSEEDVSEFEKKVSEARKFVWGWTGGIKVKTKHWTFKK